MTPKDVAALGPAFAAYVREFKDCFVHDHTREHLHTYCRGLLSDLPRKSVKPIVLGQRPCRPHPLNRSVARMFFVKESRIAAPPETVFHFHQSRGATQHLIPPWEKMEVVESSGSLQPGSKVVLKGRLGLFPIRWVAIHTEYEPPRLFADRQEFGPFPTGIIAIDSSMMAREERSCGTRLSTSLRLGPSGGGWPAG